MIKVTMKKCERGEAGGVRVHLEQEGGEKHVLGIAGEVDEAGVDALMKQFDLSDGSERVSGSDASHPRA